MPQLDLLHRHVETRMEARDVARTWSTANLVAAFCQFISFLECKRGFGIGLICYDEICTTAIDSKIKSLCY
jgi:hypothetical protein